MSQPKPEHQELTDMAHKLRIHSIRSTNASNSGHPTSCASIAEIMSVLFFRTMRFKVTEPRDPSNDRLVLSKGHAAPILYAAWAEAGLFPVDDLMNNRKIDSDLEGHPTPRLNFVDVATGSLGQGLSNACGMAYVGKNFDRANYRVYCIIGDGESAEGSVWEAMNFASYYKLDNLCVIVDVNRMGQTGQTSLGHDIEKYQKRFEAFGFHTICVDGHKIDELVAAFDCATTTKEKPTVIVAKTFKGKHFPGIEDAENWHGKPLGNQGPKVIEHLESLICSKGPIKMKSCRCAANFDAVKEADHSQICLSKSPDYKSDDQVATRSAYGTGLVKIMQNNSKVVALDAETKNSTFSIKAMEFDPSRFIECFICEQNCVGVAIGASCRSRTIPFVSSFGAFWTRAFDQVRMGAISQCNVKFCGSHVGVSIGEDGPSQMALEDIAMFRAIPGSVVFYPSDAVSCERAVELAANIEGIVYIRTSRPATPILYNNDHIFRCGESYVIKKSANDQVLIIAGGVTLHEALRSAGKLENGGIHVRVMDIFTVKPIDKKAIICNANECCNRIITVEDHYPQGGLGEAVLSAIADQENIKVKIMAVPGTPRSGKPAELLDYFGISCCKISLAIRDILGDNTRP